MASDLPDMGWGGPKKMARKLVTYLDCPYQVRQRLKEEDFQRNLPSIATIQAMRAEYLASKTKPVERPFKAFEGYRPNELSDKARETSKLFLARLQRERDISAERARMAAYERDVEKALRSNFLTRPALVDARWEALIEDLAA